jgi:acetyltransferase-like isoleucine patch superfamily enzyme
MTTSEIGQMPTPSMSQPEGQPDAPGSGDAPVGFFTRLRWHWQKTGPWGHLLGLILRTRFQKAGIVLVYGSWTLPAIENRGGRIEVGSHCTFFSGVHLEVWEGATLKIGSGTYLNRNSEVVAARSVTIGTNCKIARDVLIMDTDQHALPGCELVIEPVVVEDDVWIGARAIILKGVRLGHGSVVAAGAVVTKSVPPRSVVAGVPARVIRTLPAEE